MSNSNDFRPDYNGKYVSRVFRNREEADRAFAELESRGYTKDEELKTRAKLGDFIRIDIPGSGSLEGDGYDWVKVTKIDKNPYEDDERFLMVCVPSVNPTAENTQDIAHFYSNKASSNFIVRRKDKCIYAEIHGRNEISNLTTENIPDKIRNAVVSIMGRLGISKIQWISLAEGLIDN